MGCSGSKDGGAQSTNKPEDKKEEENKPEGEQGEQPQGTKGKLDGVIRCGETRGDKCEGKGERELSKSTDTRVTRVRYTSRQGICYFYGAEVSYLVIAKICLYPV